MLVLSLPADRRFDFKLLSEGFIDVIEYRLDDLPFTPEKLVELKQQMNLPVMFTLRSARHGGKFDESLEIRLEKLEGMAKANPEYLDIEDDVPDCFFEHIKKNYPDIKIIQSYHQLNNDFEAFMQTFKKMLLRESHGYKLVMQVDSSLDTFKLMNFLKEYSQEHTLTCIPMGEHGSFGRILAKKLGNQFHFCAGVVETAAGQFNIDDLENIYNFRNINSSTSFYGLIGQPIDKSVGHIFHNDYFKKNNINAVYVKIDVNKKDFKQALQYLKTFEFKGMSITMPLKKEFLQNESINTLKLVHQDWVSYSTDGMGAYLAIKNHMIYPPQKVVILGQGGSAIAIEKTFYELGFDVKTIHRASFGSNWPAFDIIINTLPQNAFIEYPILISRLKRILKSNHLCLDINYHEKTSFYELVSKMSLKVISGLEMFEQQALLQQEIWF